MEGLFLKIFNMSITASWIALAVMLLRLPLKKAPKWVMGVLWAFVALRLIFPIRLESFLSLIPSAQTLPADFTYTPAPVINSGIPAVNSAVNPVISEWLAPEPYASANPTQILSGVASLIWIIGVVGMLLYMLISYLALKRKVREGIAFVDSDGYIIDKKVRICDRIPSPFILGVIFPKIYLPSDLDENDMQYVMEHERTHISRGDHLWKPLGFLLLSVYWFNPILWVAYILMCRDIELACDEKVIRTLGEDSKKAYSEALINCSAPRHLVSACPLAFGEVGVKERIKRVLSYKKPAFWIIIAAAVSCVVVAVCFLTNPQRYTRIGDFIDHYGLEAVTDVWIQNEGLGEVESLIEVSKGTAEDSYHIDSALLEDYIKDVAKIRLGAKQIPTQLPDVGSPPYYIIGVRIEYASGAFRRISTAILNFNADFTEFWLGYDAFGKPRWVYSVRDPEKVERLFSWIDKAEPVGVNRYENFNGDTVGDKKDNSVAPVQPTIFGRYYAAYNTIVQSLVFSSIQRPEFAPVFEFYNSRYDGPYQKVVPAEGLTLISRDTGEQVDFGDAEEITLTKENFDDLFTVAVQWEDGINPEYLRKNAEKVYNFSNGTEFYYIIKTNSGELYALNGSIYREGENITKRLIRGYRLTDVTPGPNSLGGYIDHAFFDVDGDGEQETCILSYGPTSGLYTFMFTVRQGDKYEYNTIFCPQFTYLRDPTNFENGYNYYSNYRFALKGDRYIVTTVDKSPAIKEQLELEISIKDGEIVLTDENGTKMRVWGDDANFDVANGQNLKPNVDVWGSVTNDDDPIIDDSDVGTQPYLSQAPLAKINADANPADISGWFDTSAGEDYSVRFSIPFRFSMPRLWQLSADGSVATQNGKVMMKIVAVYKAEEQPTVDKLVANLVSTVGTDNITFTDNSANKKADFRYMLKLSEKDADSVFPQERYYYFVERRSYCFCLRFEVNEYSNVVLNESLFPLFYDNMGGALEPTEFEHVYIRPYSHLNAARNGFDSVSENEDDRVFISLFVPADWNWNRGTADINGIPMFSVGRIYPAAENDGFEILKQGASEITEPRSGDKYSYKLRKTVDGEEVLVYLLKRDGLCAELIFNVNEDFDEDKCERLVETFDMMDLNNHINE